MLESFKDNWGLRFLHSFHFGVVSPFQRCGVVFPKVWCPLSKGLVSSFQKHGVLFPKAGESKHCRTLNAERRQCTLAKDSWNSQMTKYLTVNYSEKELSYYALGTLLPVFYCSVCQCASVPQPHPITHISHFPLHTWRRATKIPHCTDLHIAKINLFRHKQCALQCTILETSHCKALFKHCTILGGTWLVAAFHSAEHWSRHPSSTFTPAVCKIFTANGLFQPATSVQMHCARKWTRHNMALHAVLDVHGAKCVANACYGGDEWWD